MPNGNFNRNERFNNPGRDRNDGPTSRDGGQRRTRGDFPDWDRNGSYRDLGRADYTPGDREAWQTDDLGYGHFGNNDDGYRRNDRSAYENRTGYNDDNRSQTGRRDFVDRATDEVASWFGNEDAERRRRMDQHRGKGPKGYTRTDERIKDDVNDRLSDDPMLDASDIEVTVASGEVTLNGYVTTRQDKRRAEDTAEAVSGVNNVQNNLRVKPNEDVTSIVS